MNIIPKDVLEQISRELSPRDFISLCASKRGENICHRPEVWFRRLQKDFNEVIPYLQDVKINAKKYYLELFKQTSETSEKLVEELLENYFSGKGINTGLEWFSRRRLSKLGADAKKYKTVEFKNEIYDVIFKSLLRSLNNALTFGKVFDRDLINSIVKKYFNHEILVNNFPEKFWSNPYIRIHIDERIDTYFYSYLREILLFYLKLTGGKEIRRERSPSLSDF